MPHHHHQDQGGPIQQLPSLRSGDSAQRTLDARQALRGIGGSSSVPATPPTDMGAPARTSALLGSRKASWLSGSVVTKAARSRAASSDTM
jgi:hypothetical protein